MSKNIYTPEEEQQIIDLYLQNKTAKEIRDIVGHKGCRDVIYNIIKRNNIHRQPSASEIIGRKLDGYQDIERKICDIYQSEKLTLAETGKRVGLGLICVEKILKKYGIERHKPSEFLQKYICDENYFNKIDTHEKAYILGFIYADGSICSKEYRFQISLQEEDKYILDFMNQQFHSNRPLRFLPYSNKNIKRKNQYRLTIQNKTFYYHLTDLGITPTKTFDATFPNIPDEYKKSFILGYFDGDGCIYVSHNCAHISFVGTYEMVSEISKYIYNCIGEDCKIYEGQNRKYKDNTKNTFVLQTGGNKKVKKIMDWLYDGEPVFLERKYNKYYNHFYINNSLIA